jgi:hypothetical protein
VASLVAATPRCAAPRTIIRGTSTPATPVEYAVGETTCPTPAAVNRSRDFRTGDVHPIDPGLLDLRTGWLAASATRSR